MMQDAPPTEALLDGRYRLAEQVGEGGMATVYRAEDIMLERTVAVKMLRGTPVAAVSADRAHTEKALLASLSHPSLVTLLDAQLNPGRTQYLVMEFVPGPTLSARMARSPIAPEEVAQIGSDLAAALHAVHAAGIVHRDVKPSNVLLVPPAVPDARWHAKLTDFGIACPMDTERVTSPGFVLGTPTYMAPEQLRGAEPRPALDVYALGLVLIEALTGQPGFPPGLSIESSLSRLHLPPEIPDTLDPAWTSLLRRMTDMDPELRPHARDLIRELEPLASRTAPWPVPQTQELPTAATAVEAVPSSHQTPVPSARVRVRRTRRPRVLLTAAAVLLVGAATGVTAAFANADGAAAWGGAVQSATMRVATSTPDAETDAPVAEEPAVAPATVADPVVTQETVADTSTTRGTEAAPDAGSAPSEVRGPDSKPDHTGPGSGGKGKPGGAKKK